MMQCLLHNLTTISYSTSSVCSPPNSYQLHGVKLELLIIDIFISFLLNQSVAKWEYLIIRSTTKCTNERVYYGMRHCATLAKRKLIASLMLMICGVAIEFVISIAALLS